LKKRHYRLITAFKYWEIALLTASFVGILYLLFPEGKIEYWIVKAEKSNNIDLTKKYIEALLRVKAPTQLKLKILEIYAAIGTDKEIKKIIAQIRKKNPVEALKLEFLYYEGKYKRAKYEADRELLKRKMELVLKEIVTISNNLYLLQFAFKKAILYGFPKIALAAAQKLVLITGQENWVEELFDIAYINGRYDIMEIYAYKFKPTKPLTYLAYYALELRKRNFKAALYYLNRYIALKGGKVGVELKQDLAVLLIATGRVNEGLNLLRRYFKNRQKLYLFVMKRLLDLGAYTALKRFIEGYALKVSGNSEYYSEILKIALATGDTEFAHRVAIQIAKRLRLINR
jgi:hypothetical protein